MPGRRIVGAATVFCSLLSLSHLTAQCPTDVVSMGIVPGTSGEIRSMHGWDPDGAGPLGEHLLLTGDFEAFGPLLVNGIALYDPATQTATSFGAGLGGLVRDAVGLSNGNVVAVGNLGSGSRVEMWDGVSWSPLGSIGTSPSHTPFSVVEMPNGDIVIGGFFSTAGGVVVNHVARWDGSAWHALGTGVNAYITDMIVMPNGDLIVAGYFDTAGGVAADSIARWDGSSWSAIGAATTTDSGHADALGLAANGDLLVAGRLTNFAGVGALNIARWDGTNWNALGAGTQVFPTTVIGLPNGDIVTNYRITFGQGAVTTSLGRWDGSTWQTLDVNLQGGGKVATATSNGDLYVDHTRDPGFHLSAINGQRVSRFDGTNWHALFPGFSGEVDVVLPMRNGDVIVAGGMEISGVPNTRGIARWDGNAWHALGPGAEFVRCMAELPNGDLVVGGPFQSIGGQTMLRVARWDGSAWHAMGSGLGVQGAFVPDTVHEMLALPNGDLIVTGYFFNAGTTPVSRVARWDGSTWHPFGSLSFLLTRAMLLRSNGEIVVGGKRAGSPGSEVLKWNGTSWVGLGLVQDVYSLAELPDGTIIAGGDNDLSSGEVAQFDGTSWSPVGAGLDGQVSTLVTLPGGDLVASGGFTQTGSGIPTNLIARWNGSSWSPFHSTDRWLRTMAVAPEGELWVGGAISRLDSTVTSNVGKIITTCPSSTTLLGGGCPGSTGQAVLTPSTAYLGDVWSTVASNLPSSIVARVLGLSAISLPLSIALPAPAVCDLVASPDAIDVFLPVGGVVTATLDVPATAALVGLPLYSQMVALELGPQFNIVQASATNAVEVVIGSW